LGLRRSFNVLIILFAEVENSTITTDLLGNFIPVDDTPVDNCSHLLGVFRILAFSHDGFFEDSLN
jgi:hypothetical protein